MKLTKIQRHMAYMIMLAEAESLEYGHVSTFNNITEYPYGLYGLCHLVFDCFGITDDVYGVGNRSLHYVISDNFPELQAKKSKYGWPAHSLSGWEERRDFLKQCIEETEDAWPK